MDMKIKEPEDFPCTVVLNGKEHVFENLNEWNIFMKIGGDIMQIEEDRQVLGLDSMGIWEARRTIGT